MANLWRYLWCWMALLGLLPPASADHPLLWDPVRSMLVGAVDVATTQEYIAAGEERLLSTRCARGKLSGLGCRTARYLLLDHAIDHLALQTQMAFFGWGSRLGETDYSGSEYEFQLPFPYDNGEVKAIWGVREPASRVLSFDEVLMLHTAQLEAATVLAGELSHRWVARRSVHYREAALFLKATFEPLRKIYAADSDITANSSTSDIACYIRFINKSHEKALPEDHELTIGALKRRALIGLINPFVLAAISTGVRTYLWQGEAHSDLPMMSIAGHRFLPALHMNLSPFGPEYVLSNHLALKKRAVEFTVRIGEPTFYYLWGGIGLHITPLLRRARLTADLHLDLWGQPSLTLGGDELWDTREGFGCAVLTRLATPSPWRRLPIDFLFEVGAKSAGYLEGHPLDEALMLRLGFATCGQAGD